MKKITQTITSYECSICNHVYATEKEALSCESKKITGDKGVKKGGRVMILSGDGKGELATVESIHIKDKYWGHYVWKRYWHTVSVTAKLDSGGHRLLTFDSYELA